MNYLINVLSYRGSSNKFWVAQPKNDVRMPPTCFSAFLKEMEKLPFENGYNGITKIRVYSVERQTIIDHINEIGSKFVGFSVRTN